MGYAHRIAWIMARKACAQDIYDPGSLYIFLDFYCFLVYKFPTVLIVL